LKALFDDLHASGINIVRLNYGIITFVPKCPDVKQI
jgi:hypothetical protein